MFLPAIDKESLVPLSRQIYLTLREAILSGQLKPSLRLASSRNMAQQLAVSRNVVLEAYEQLLAEGFLETRQGAGTYVMDGAAFATSGKLPKLEVTPVNMGYDAPRHLINFRAGTPQLRLFPSREWLRMIREVLALPAEKYLNYGQPEGHRELREAICEYVVHQRAVRCQPDQIIVTGGTTQAITICCRLLLETRKNILLEDPITRDIQHIAVDHGAELFPVPVDDDGMRTSLLPDGISPAFIYVTPSHQFPTGTTLPIQRRLQLIHYATKYQAYIVEDDYDSEFRFDGPPLSSLHGLAPERVLYIGTFSKTLCPGLRMGYLIVPGELIYQARQFKWRSDLHNEVVSQLALARFIRQGHYFRHLARMRHHYRGLRSYITGELQRQFGQRVELMGSSTGLHLVARFSGQRFDDGFFARLEQNGARFYPVEMHSIVPGNNRDKLLIGYGHLEKAEIERGIAILAAAIAETGDKFAHAPSERD